MFSARDVQAFLLLLHWVSAISATLRLTFTREYQSNDITLICRDQSYLAVENADFWVNSTNQQLTFRLPPMSYSIPTTGQFSFTITPELEGDYYCGRVNDTQFVSSGLTLVGEQWFIYVSGR